MSVTVPRSTPAALPVTGVSRTQAPARKLKTPPGSAGLILPSGRPPKKPKLAQPPQPDPAARARRTPPGTPDFRVGLVDVPEEVIAPTPCRVIGTLPPECHGTLYRNGPGRFTVGGERIKHWFDGDGKISAVHLGPEGATYQSRFVDTVARQNERRMGKRLYSGLGGLPRHGPIGAWRGWLGKNVANTNVAFFGDRLYALYEGGRPYRLDTHSLATLGEDDHGGLVGPGWSASAHPRQHTRTGDMWNFKIRYGKKNTVQLYRTDQAGHAADHTAFELPYMTMVHDFCLTETRAVFVLSPYLVQMHQLPLYLLGLKPMCELPKLHPEAGSYMVTIALDGKDLQPRVAHFDTPVLVLHTVNAWDEGDSVVLDACDFGMADSLNSAVTMMSDGPVQRGMPKIRRLRQNGRDTVHTALLGDTQLEFPKVAPHVLHRPHTKIYGVQWPEDRDYVGVPACYDITTDTVTTAPMAPGCYACEGVLVSKQGAVREDEVYVLTVVLDTRTATSSLHIYDGEALEAGPVAQVELPQMVPHGLHGSWQPEGTQGTDPDDGALRTTSTPIIHRRI